MATRKSTKVALSPASQPKGTRVGLVSDFGVYSYGATFSASAGDIIQMVKVPIGASLVYFELSGGSGDALVTLGDTVSTARYLTSVTMGSTSTLIRTCNVPRIPYQYSVDSTIDITIGTVSVGTITGGFNLFVVFTMDPQ